LAIVEQLISPVRPHGDRMDFEGQTRGIRLWVNVAGLLRFVNSAGEHANPLMHDRGNAVAHYPLPAVELERGRAEEAPSAEDAFLYKSEPKVKKPPKPGHPFASRNGRAGDLFDEYLASLFYGRQLKIFFGAEMGEQATFAHAQLLGEGADGEAFEALDGSNVDSASEDGLAGPQAAGLVARNDFLPGGGCGLEHRETIAQEN
jgi:hypothetical protein